MRCCFGSTDEMATKIPEDRKVIHSFVGRSGLKVSNLCLGCVTFGSTQFGFPGQCDEDTSHKIINRYTKWGGNFLDTADTYGYGSSETVVGKWLEKQPRDKYVIATKCRFSDTPEPEHNFGLNRRYMTASIDRSLQRLHTDFIDLYQGHLWDAGTPLEETLRTFDDLIRIGKVRYMGMSNVSGWQMQKLMDTCHRLGLNPIISLQQQYSLDSRASELEAFQVCKAEGVGILAYSPLRAGALTGKVKRGVKPTEGRLGWAAGSLSRSLEVCPHWSLFDDRTYNTIEAVEAISKKRGRTMAQVAIRWLLQKDIVSSVIIGARTMAQLDDNMGANGWNLTKEEMKQLDDASLSPPLYPYNMLINYNADRFNFYVSDVFAKTICPESS